MATILGEGREEGWRQKIKKEKNEARVLIPVIGV